MKISIKQENKSTKVTIKLSDQELNLLKKNTTEIKIVLDIKIQPEKAQRKRRN